MSEHLPNLDLNLFDGAHTAAPDEHKPRILLLYGSNRERSFSRLLVQAFVIVGNQLHVI